VSTGCLLVAEIGGTVAGFAVVEKHSFGDESVELIKVDPAAGRRGVATALPERMSSSRSTSKLLTSTNLSNHPMQRLMGASARSKSAAR
jgi:ribosomal protein S18 acetylase RimI-like enzyme